MERVEEDKAWTLFCPSDAPQLSELFGDAFDLEYEKLERLGKGRKTVKARELWQEILTSQIESGGPFVMFKDSINGAWTDIPCQRVTNRHCREEQPPPHRDSYTVEFMHRDCTVLRLRRGGSLQFGVCGPPVVRQGGRNVRLRIPRGGRPAHGTILEPCPPPHFVALRGCDAINDSSSRHRHRRPGSRRHLCQDGHPVRLGLGLQTER